jgi:glycosyltransferase involved in cell wall biosynthesis
LPKSPLVSVIVPTKNSEGTIESCLRSIKGQTYPRIEIIIVDGCSSDRTRKIAEDQGATIYAADLGRSEARNVGAQVAKGSFVFFVDSDMKLDSAVVCECVQKLADGYDGAVVPEISVGEGFWSRCKALERACYIGDDSIEAARFFKRSVFQDVGGYDPELEAGEDWDLNQRVMRAGFRIGRVRALIKHDEGKLRLWETLVKKYRYGKTLRKYRTRNLRESRLQFILIRPSFLRNRRKLAQQPSALIGMLFMRLCESTAALSGMLVSRQQTRKALQHAPVLE